MKKFTIPTDISSVELEKLVNNCDYETKRQIAKNPNATPEILEKLFSIFPVEVLNNAAIKLILLEDPKFLQRLSDRCSFKELLELCRSGDRISDSFYELISNYSDSNPNEKFKFSCIKNFYQINNRDAYCQNYSILKLNLGRHQLVL